MDLPRRSPLARSPCRSYPAVVVGLLCPIIFCTVTRSTSHPTDGWLLCTSQADLPRLQEMHRRFEELGMQTKADVLSSQIRRLSVNDDVSAVIAYA